jgi:putative peptidoglycan lipid II flippase
MGKRKKPRRGKPAPKARAPAGKAGRLTAPPTAPPGQPAAGLARSAGAASVATMLSRVTGLVREQVIAFMFGAGAATDAYNVAFRIPNLLRDLFAEGALNSAFVPTFSERLARDGRERAFALANRVMGGLILITGLITVAGLVFTPQVVGLMASGMLKTPEQADRTILLTRILMPFLTVIALAAVSMGALNVLGQFFLPALAPVMLNVGSVVIGGGLALAAPRLGIEPITGLAIGTMVGGLLQWTCQLPALRREGFRMRPRVDFKDEGVRDILKLMAPATLANGSTQINLLVNTQIASWLVEGSISWLAYAFRLMQLPIGIFGVSVGLASQPAIKRHLTLGEHDKARDSLAHALRLVFVCTVPASVALFVLARPIIGLLYEYRNFSAHAADETAAALSCYALGLVGFSAVKVLAPAYYALKDSSVPVKASIASVVANIALSLALMKPLGHRGLALATSLNGLLNMSLLLFPLPARLPGFSVAGVFAALARVCAASAGMGAMCLATSAALGSALGTTGFLVRLVTVMGSLATGTAVLVALLKAFRVPEIDEVLRLVTRRFTKA